jgi:hypothetical protein
MKFDNFHAMHGTNIISLGDEYLTNFFPAEGDFSLAPYTQHSVITSNDISFLTGNYLSSYNVKYFT